MKRISMLCFSPTGYETGKKLRAGLCADGLEVRLDAKSRYLPESISESHSQWTGEQFSEADALIFIGACGIAVRSIAPFVKSKKTDPAVLVVDECGKFVISLLSGHLGGANELAEKAAGILQAIPVVTTATDLHSTFAVDVFASRNHCGIFHMKAAKEVSAALLAGNKAGFFSRFPFEGTLPAGLILCDASGRPTDSVSEKPEVGIAVTVFREENPFAETVHVVPKAVSLGMGCKKGREPEIIRAAAEACIHDSGIYRESLEALASASLKKEEAGLLALSESWNLPFRTYETEELLKARGDFTPSEFVRQVTGADNVCERSAVLSAAQGKIIRKKTGGSGVTTALAVRDWRIHFE